VASSFFVVELFELKEPQSFRTNDSRTKDEAGKSSVQILVAVEGCAVIEAQGAEPVTLAKGDAVVVPASIADFHVRPQWTVEFLKAALPGQTLPEPETRI
jgi:mannose-6-phosphate isomerase class I